MYRITQYLTFFKSYTIYLAVLGEIQIKRKEREHRGGKIFVVKNQEKPMELKTAFILF